MASVARNNAGMTRLILLCTLTMVAFAANSVLNRLALAVGEAGAIEFAVLRTLSGAVALAVLVLVGSGDLRAAMVPTPRRITATLALALYMFAFSLAYLVLDAGAGALILFGGVQITMFAGGVLGGEAVPIRRWIGSALALAGLAWLLWPGSTSAPPLGWSVVMGAAAIGWGVYSLLGRSGGPPLPGTAANFIYAVPVAAVVAVIGLSGPLQISNAGIMLAILSGVVTSGLGYALWYTVLPQLSASVAALTQLSVPVIAMVGGVLFLSEPITERFVIATIVVLGGIAFGIGWPGQRS
jgi:drug/metabolite transporter (DMT)-like permease